MIRRGIQNKTKNVAGPAGETFLSAKIARSLAKLVLAACLFATPLAAQARTPAQHGADWRSDSRSRPRRSRTPRLMSRICRAGR